MGFPDAHHFVVERSFTMYKPSLADDEAVETVVSGNATLLDCSSPLTTVSVLSGIREPLLTDSCQRTTQDHKPKAVWHGAWALKHSLKFYHTFSQPECAMTSHKLQYFRQALRRVTTSRAVSDPKGKRELKRRDTH